jgi:hypothetical protein
MPTARRMDLIGKHYAVQSGSIYRRPQQMSEAGVIRMTNANVREAPRFGGGLAP